MFSQLNRLPAQEPTVSRSSNVCPTESSHQKHSEWKGQMGNDAKSGFREGCKIAAPPPTKGRTPPSYPVAVAGYLRYCL